jgi:sporulation protein YlmC with PRC-barrel domain
VKSLRTSKIIIGSEVRCIDGRCGFLQRVVIEPAEGVVTHLVVEANHRGKAPYLIPVETVIWAEQGSPDAIQLRCTLAELRSFETAPARHFLAGASGRWGYRQEQMYSWPNYRMGRNVASPTAQPDSPTRPHHHAHRQSNLAEVEVRRGDHVWATDGPLGRVQGLIVDRSDRHVTHILLDEGDIWGQKRAAIPIDSIVALRELDDGVQVDLTREQVNQLPPIELDIQE